MNFAQQHFGDYIGIFLILLGVAIIVFSVVGHYDGQLSRTGDGLVGAGLLALKLKPSGGEYVKSSSTSSDNGKSVSSGV